MATINFSININASKETVWAKLWEDSSYREWTAAFNPGSYAESDWKEGSKVRFLGAGNNGMFGIIEKLVPNRQMTFRHIGEVKDGVEVPKDWSTARESYHLAEENGSTKVDVELTMDDNLQFEQYFNATFPKALEILKQISEN